MSVRHKQASKTWRSHQKANNRRCTKRAENWKAVNTVTREYCPHMHHTEASALRCGASLWERDFKAMRWRS